MSLSWHHCFQRHTNAPLLLSRRQFHETFALVAQGDDTLSQALILLASQTVGWIANAHGCIPREPACAAVKKETSEPRVSNVSRVAVGLRSARARGHCR